MQYCPSISELATGSGLGPDVSDLYRSLIKNLAAELMAVAQRVFPDSASNELAQPLSPGARILAQRARTGPVPEDKKRAAEQVAELALTLRGVFSVATREPIADPYPIDILTTDMNDVLLPHAVVPQLHARGLGPSVYGEPTPELPKFRIGGILYGFNARPMVTMIVECNGVKIKLPMFVHTGGILTCLNASSLAKLIPNFNRDEWASGEKSIPMMVHGVGQQVHLATGNAMGVNVVGKNWLETAKAFFVAGYFSGGCLITSDTHEVRQHNKDYPSQV